MKTCRNVNNALDTVFFNRMIRTPKEAISLVGEINPRLGEHLKDCEACGIALTEKFGSIPSSVAGGE